MFPLPPQHASLSDEELDRLDDFLQSDETPAACMTLSELDGFLTAILVGPNTLLPSQWFDEIWGGTEDEPMQFASEARMQEILDLVMRLYKQRAGELIEDNDLFDPIVYAYEEEGKTHRLIDDWCYGFMTGLSLDAEGWDPLFHDDANAALLTPMLLYGTETGIEERKANPQLSERHENLADAIGLCVIGIRDFWLPHRKAGHTVRRESPKVGRNDPCPCGNGKKFKKCCGSPERLH